MSSLDIIVAVPSGAGWVPVHAMADLLARYTGGTVHTVDVGASLSKETKLLARLPRLKGGSRRCVVIASDPGQLYAVAQRSFAFRRYGAIYGWVIDSFWDDRIPAIAKSSVYDRIFVADADDVVGDLLEDLDLTRVAGHLPEELSSGQRRRLALASVLARPRRLLILDEPEQRLDRVTRLLLADRLIEERDCGGGVLMVSHDPEIVEEAATQVLLVGRSTRLLNVADGVRAIEDGLQ